MGAKKPGIMPSWVQTVHAMAAEPACHVRAICWTCGEFRDIDLQALAAKVGPEYSLINRCSPCKLTPGCKGWVKFMYNQGVMRNLWTYEQEWVWDRRDKERANAERMERPRS